jgi:succinoglycan biosynthesis protein ExoW
MDSDDIWLPGFLEHARPALALGVDIYFCDSGRHQQPQSRLLWDADERLNVRAEGRRPVEGGKHLYWFEEPFFDFMLRRSNILGPSSTVYRLDCAPRLRFDSSLYNGQDRLFKIKLARTVRTASFCDQVLCHEGEGVNIFDSAVWGSRKALRLAASYISLHKKILGEVDLDPAQTAFIVTRVEAARRDFAANALRLMSNPSEMDWTLFVRTVAADPRVISTALRHALARLTERRRRLE